MTEDNKKFILNDDLNDLEDYKCVMDNYADVDTWYTLGATVDLLNKLLEENEQLKAQLYCDSDEGVCIICKHHYLEKGKTYEKYYISKCKKGHEQCSKRDLKYCDDFELKKGDV